MKRSATRLLWSLFFLIRGLVGMVILFLAVVATGICYLIAFPWLLFQSGKQR